MELYIFMDKVLKGPNCNTGLVQAVSCLKWQNLVLWRCRALGVNADVDTVTAELMVSTNQHINQLSYQSTSSHGNILWSPTPLFLQNTDLRIIRFPSLSRSPQSNRHWAQLTNAGSAEEVAAIMRTQKRVAVKCASLLARWSAHL